MILQTECIKPSLLVLYAEVQPIFADFRSAKIVFIFYSHNTNFGRLCLNVSTYGISG